MAHIIEIERDLAPKSQIVMDSFLVQWHKYTNSKKVIIITDQNVFNCYGSFISAYKHIIIPPSEENKTLATLGLIYEKLISLEADRHSYLVGFGGGIVTDITGFVASTYMRGLGFGFVASTVLAQVDASVGGKNGVNFMSYKNMVGCFNQPDFVLCDIELFKTLPEREMRGGLSEALKAGLIKSPALFSIFENNSYSKITSSKELLTSIVRSAIEIKAQVVASDFKEAGERKKLNFGHTLGHAIEKCSREYTHGEAVAIGMAMASKISVSKGMLSDETHKRVVKVISQIGLPTSCNIDTKDLFEALHSDKKRAGASIDFILLSGIGQSEIVPLSFDELQTLLGL